MSNRTKKLNYKRATTVSVSGSSPASFRVGIVIPATCYGLRFNVEPDLTDNNDIIAFKWKLVRDLNVEKNGTPEYDGQLDENYLTEVYSLRRSGAGNPITEFNAGLVEIDNIRLIDNHVLWIEHGEAAHFFEVMYITGY